MMMFGWFFMIAVFVAVVALLVWGGSTAGRAFWTRGNQPPGDEYGGERSALQILEERFASGEIDREEFERRREVLSKR